MRAVIQRIEIGAAELQPAGLPEPTVRSGFEVSTPRPSTGAAGPPGRASGALRTVVLGAASTLPALGGGGSGGRVVVGAALGVVVAAGAATVRTSGRVPVPHAASTAEPTTTRHTRRNRTAGR